MAAVPAAGAAAAAACCCAAAWWMKRRRAAVAGGDGEGRLRGTVSEWLPEMGYGCITAAGGGSAGGDAGEEEDVLYCPAAALCGGGGGALVVGGAVTFVKTPFHGPRGGLERVCAVGVRGPGVVAAPPTTIDEWAVHIKSIAHYVGATDGHVRPPQPCELGKSTLLLGGIRQAKDVQLLEQMGVSAVLNMAPRPDHCGAGAGRGYPPHFELLDIDADDSEEYDIFASDVPRALEFLRTCRAAGRRVLVHCYEGKNRSATVCAAWLVSEEGMALVPAVRHIAARRGEVLQNRHFCAGLAGFARPLREAGMS